MIGGGTGLVPLIRLIKFVNCELPPSHDLEITLLMGSQTKEEVFFKFMELIEKYMDANVIPVTEDGSYGEKGYVTDVLEKLLEENTYDAIYTCGPELMMHKTVKLANEKEIFVQASLELSLIHI